MNIRGSRMGAEIRRGRTLARACATWGGKLVYIASPPWPGGTLPRLLPRPVPRSLSIVALHPIKTTSRRWQPRELRRWRAVWKKMWRDSAQVYCVIYVKPDTISQIESNVLHRSHFQPWSQEDLRTVCNNWFLKRQGVLQRPYANTPTQFKVSTG